MATSKNADPVAEWMKELHLVIEDEGQQYGNMEEAASIAGTSRAWIETWSGDHHQTDSNTQRKRMPFAENLTIPPPACVEVSRLCNPLLQSAPPSPHCGLVATVKMQCSSSQADH